MAKVKAVPEGMHTITPQLSLDGASEAIEFFKKAFGAEEINRAVDPSGKKVWHAALRIGSSTIFVNDTFPEMGGGADKASLWIYGDDCDGVYKRAISFGAKEKMPPADMFWGDRMAAVVDKWGNTWNLATHVRDMTPEDMKKAQDEFVASQKK